MSASSAAADKPTLDGSCHCGAVKFAAKSVDLADVCRCNCSICNISGRVGVPVKDGDLFVVKSDGSQFPLHIDSDRSEFPPGQSVYGRRHTQHHFCNKCGIHVFSVSDVPSFGIYIGVNVLCLDLKKIGVDIKDVSHPSKVTYCDGRSDTWERRKGEPWPGGAW
ncbi:hypothetical protein LshimejAT787_0704910 [Lyophyllum shimeji]|uniref:CENP-V/GFA domain-containing protein n=1 Tax=Lyophyllum shimeji TaxID=47721 RepID=A0A9P3PQM6_LYOSH|nr:hypothetical protein LshimejAT787_0704910 [Lyophyllum shimeji]